MVSIKNVKIINSGLCLNGKEIEGGFFPRLFEMKKGEFLIVLGQ
jgi:hypothetical protein